MEIQGLNPELSEMALRGLLSGRKIAELVRLKETVDRFAVSKYVSDDALKKLVERYGVGPDIVTWGDYFQTEIASLYNELPDRDFSKIIDTVRFDLISAVKIFQGKSPEFFNMVEADGLAAYGMPRETWSEREEEQAHLYILMQYYHELGLAAAALAPADETWFNGFVAADSHAVGQ